MIQPVYICYTDITINTNYLIYLPASYIFMG